MVNDFTFPLERIFWTAQFLNKFKKNLQASQYFLDKGDCSCPLQQTLLTGKVKHINLPIV